MKHLFTFIYLLPCFFATAQKQAGNSAYVPFNQYFQQNHTHFVWNDNSRMVSHDPVTYGHYHWATPANTWNPADSGTYYFNSQDYDTTDVNFRYASGAWNLTIKDIYTYDSHNKPLTQLRQTWDTSQQAWVNTYLTTYTYDANENITANVELIWDAGADSFVNVQQFLNTYDVNNNRILYLDEVWDNTNSVWANGQKVFYTYDSHNNKTILMYLMWNTGTSMWDSSLLTTFTYDANNNELSQTDLFHNTGTWVNSDDEQFTYNANNNRITYTSRNWDAGNSVWVNSNLSLYNYDANNNDTIDAVFVWDGTNNVWDSSSLGLYTYNAANLPLMQITESYDTAWEFLFKNVYTYDSHNNQLSYGSFNYNNGWVPGSLYQYQYDSHNNHTYELYQYYNADSAALINSDEYFYYRIYNGANGISELKNEIAAVIYPNPSTSGGNIYLRYTLDAATGGVGINIYDVQGRVVSSENRPAANGVNSTQLNYPGMPAGNYFAQIIDKGNGKSSVLQFVKQ